MHKGSEVHCTFAFTSTTTTYRESMPFSDMKCIFGGKLKKTHAYTMPSLREKDVQHREMEMVSARPRNIEEQPSGRTSGIIFELVLWSHLKKKNSPEIVVTSSKISVPIYGTWARRRTALHQISYSMVNKHLETKFHTEEQPSKCHE